MTEERPTLDIIDFCNAQDEIMSRNYETKEKNPDSYLEFATARMMKTYILREHAIQKGEPFSAKWVKKGDKEVCSVCWENRKNAELDGMCVSCGAQIKEEP